METKPKLSSFSDLFKSAIGDFKARFKSIIIFSLISLAASFLLSGFAAAGIVIIASNIILGLALILVGVLLFMAVSYLTSGAFVYAMKDGSGVKESFKFIFRNFWSFIWIMVLMMLVIIPGFVALIIPGILLSVLLSFGMFAFMDEGLKGSAALMRSKEYVTGYFWPIAGKFGLYILVVLGAAIGAGIVTGIISIASKELGSFVQALFNAVIITPIGICFSWRLYKDIKEKRPEVASAPVSEKRGKIKALAVIGAVMIVAATALIVVAAPGIMSEIEKIQEEEASDTSELNLEGVDFNLDDFPTEVSE